MITRHFDAGSINAVLNDPAVRPDIAEAPSGYVDISNGVANRNNVLLMGEFGGCFFIKLGYGIYEVHTQALSEGRGKWIAKFVRDAGDWMYTRTDAYEITTRIPKEHVAAKALARHAGMYPEFTRPNEFAWRGKRQDAEIWSYRIQDWAPATDTFDQAGQVFHDFLHAEAKRLGITSPAHDDDPNHNRYVGICLALAKNGLAQKGISFYNRWALLSRHPIISLVKQSPLTVRFDIGNLVFSDDGAIRVELVDMAA